MTTKRVQVQQSTALVALRKAATAWAAGLKAPVIDARDSSFAKLDTRLRRAAVRYAASIRS